MTSAPSSTAPSASSVDRAAVAQANPKVQGGARWFWWIAGLSLVNTVVLLSGGNFNFVVGLAVTQIFDALFQSIKPLAVIFDVLALGFFFGAGYFARQGHVWAFAVGGIAYLVDGVIFGFFGDWLPVAFHIYVLFFIYAGWNELRSALRQAAEAPPALPPVLPTPPVAEVPPS